MWVSLFTAATGLAITFALGSVLLELLDERPRRRRRRAANRSYR